MTAQNKPDAAKLTMYSAYCSFKDDSYRLMALVSHDVAKVAMVGLVVLGLYVAPPKAVATLLSVLLRLLPG